MSEENTQESVVDYSEKSLEELGKLVGDGSNDDDIVDEPTEEPAVQEESEPETAEGTTDNKSDPLAKTPFKNVEALVDAYKDIQSRATRAEQSVAKLQEQYDALLSVDDGEFEEAQEEDGSGDEFMTKAEALDLVAKELEKRESVRQKQSIQEKTTSAIREARKLPNWNEDGVMDLLRAVPVADNVQLDNPLITANTIVEEGLTEIYRQNPNLHLLDDGGLRVARNLKKAESIPEIQEQTAKKAKSEIRKAEAKRSQADVATSKARARETGDVDYSKMKFEELQELVGAEEVTEEINI